MVVKSFFNLVHAILRQNNQTFTMERCDNPCDGASSHDVLLFNGFFPLLRRFPETMT
jgi:hypothetical protein